MQWLNILIRHSFLKKFKHIRPKTIVRFKKKKRIDSRFHKSDLVDVLCSAHRTQWNAELWQMLSCFLPSVLLIFLKCRTHRNEWKTTWSFWEEILICANTITLVYNNDQQYALKQVSFKDNFLTTLRPPPKKNKLKTRNGFNFFFRAVYLTNISLI